MPPRPNRIEILERIKALFPRHFSFANALLTRLLEEGLPHRSARKTRNTIFHSFALPERRIFTLIASTIPTFRGKRGVILSDEVRELAYLIELLHALVPGLSIKYVDDTVLKTHWNGFGTSAEFAEYHLLLCKPHHFFRLKYEFKGCVTNIGAICFHEVVPSAWYYHEIVALTLRLCAARHPIPLYYSAPSVLPHLQGIQTAAWSIISEQDPLALRPDITWQSLVIPITEWGAYDYYLQQSIQKVISATDPFDPAEQKPTTMLLITANKTKTGYFTTLLTTSLEDEEDRFEVLLPGDRPCVNAQVDFIFVEDSPLDPSWVGFNSYIRQLLAIFDHLKPRGTVIFFSPQGGRVGETDALISALFPIEFNPLQKEQLILYLLFRAFRTRKELSTLFCLNWKGSLIQMRQRELETRLKALLKSGVIKKVKGRYTCTNWQVDSKKPAGETLVRYRSFLEHRLQLFFAAKHKEVVGESEQTFTRAVILVRELVRRCGYYPCLTDLPLLFQIRERLLSEDHLDWLLTTQLDRYAYSRRTFARVTPQFQQFALPEGQPTQGSQDVPDFSHHRAPPIGQKRAKVRQGATSSKQLILQKVEEAWAETKTPSYWRDIVAVVGVAPTTGFRLIQALIQEGKLKALQFRHPTAPTRRLLLPKKLVVETGKLEVRGRPRLYLVPFLADTASLQFHTCGTCHMYTRTHQCELISTLLKIGSPENIRHLDIREALEGYEDAVTTPKIHPAMKACTLYHRRKRDYELTSFRPVSKYIKGADGAIIKTNVYTCHIPGCRGILVQSYHQRTFKCPKCHTKYTRVIKANGSEVFKVNVDYHSTKEAVIRQECGILVEEENKTHTKKILSKWALTKRHHTLIKHKRQKFRPAPKNIQVDRRLRKWYERKYGTAPFFRPRLIGNLISAILATLELRIFTIIEPWQLERHFYVQIEQLRRTWEASELVEFQTAERVIVNQYWQVYKSIMAHYGFDLANRKLLRHVSEFMEHPYQGSKGYSAGNALINTVHKIRYYQIRILCYMEGFGWDCPGMAEHTHPIFGLVLDLADPVKYADRFSLLQAIVQGNRPSEGGVDTGEEKREEMREGTKMPQNELSTERVTHMDLYSIFGRQDQEVFFVKSGAYQKLVRLCKNTNCKRIFYPPDSPSTSYKRIPLGEALAQSIRQLARDLLQKERLKVPFIYIPNLHDYQDLVSLLMDNKIKLEI
ncbi:MAG: hypothetical protein ACTSRL_21255 [Candidatus Helarchaeota archaeon]